ncbi:hypothetical protein QQ008_03570 [Fulvivirgaceae bacterium BMA10]|uniref:N-acetyltransferase domain-containing protein n=1 Tax=Splendidivirga corallicola TaxID=3051826 RepID=A0ABT8KK31_9BACT|nr:hypothetical protein [Fulvivirgaceae bacterium BMA10]
MNLIPVNDGKTRKEFLLLPVRLYKDNKNWIRPLDKDIEFVFDAEQNKYFKNGECERWILQNDKKQTIGRVAAFIDYRTSEKYDQPTGGMGFFECIDDREAAFKLFDKCKDWLEERGMEAMDGPINFGERDKWWGLLIDGDYEPNYCVPYNFPYYRDFFEAYGFDVSYKQFTYRREVKGGLDEKVVARANRIFKNPDYKFCSIEKIGLDKVAEDFRVTYNKSWVGYSDAKEMSKEQAHALMNNIKPILDRRLIWFAYYMDQPIAFAVMLPEINQIVKHFGGRFGIWEKLRFLWYKKTGKCNKILGVVFGVVPRFQGRGIESALITAFSKLAYDPKTSFPYKELEHNWVGDFNPQMMKVHESIGGTIFKTHATFRKLFKNNN